MAKSVDRLVAQIKKLQAQAKKLGRVRKRAIKQANALIAKFGITLQELKVGGPRRGRPPKGKAAKKARGGRRGKVAPKYRGPAGSTWTGRGLMPVWMRDAVAKGKKKDDFLIRKP